MKNLFLPSTKESFTKRMTLISIYVIKVAMRVDARLISTITGRPVRIAAGITICTRATGFIIIADSSIIVTATVFFIWVITG
jgi:hypothetical protein